MLMLTNTYVGRLSPFFIYKVLSQGQNGFTDTVCGDKHKVGRGYVYNYLYEQIKNLEWKVMSPPWDKWIC